MAALPALTSVTDLALPPLNEWHDAVRSHLTENGAVMFADELVAALWTAKETGDLREVQDVVEAWYATLAFIHKHGAPPESFERLIAARAGERPLTFAQVKAKLGL